MDKNLHKIWKRTVSILMTFFLTAGLALSNLSMVAYAAGTELPNDHLEASGVCEGTAFKWVSHTAFDMCGLTTNAKEYDASNGSDGKPKAIKTTYNWNGYSTYIQIDGTNNILVSIPNNGGVQAVGGTDNGTEVKMSLSASTDQKYILVDYYVYDKSGQGGVSGRTVKLGTNGDVQIDDDDFAAIYKNDRGFHMVNQKNQKTFDCITDDSTLGTSLGITPPTHRWIGTYNQRNANIFNESEANAWVGSYDPSRKYDSGLAYSWEFQLHPYESIHKRVAFAVRDTSYYVSDSGQDSSPADGTYAKPYKTIGYALSRIENQKGYIFLMNDYEITNPITISGADTDTTISSTDLDSSGTPVSEIKKLNASQGDSMFKVTNGAKLRLTNITLDGKGVSRESPLLSVADSSKLEINSKATVTNCHGNTSSKGSAVGITDNGSLSMNMGAVSGNTSEGKGAIYFDSTGTFNVQNGVQINGNGNGNGGAANVYLNTGKHITVDGDLGSAKIGLTTAALPAASAEGAATAAGQEIQVAVPDTEYKIDPPCPFVDNFLADQKDTGGVYIYPGSVNAAVGLPAGNDKNAVLRRNGMQLSCVLKDMAGLSIPNVSYGPFIYGPGETIDLVPPPSPAGYTLDNVAIDQGVGSGLSVSGTPGQEGYGKITGTMPSQDVSVEYTYKKGSSVIAFHVNGATTQPASLAGTAGDPVPGLLPSVTKYGYKFKCWSSNNDFAHPAPITSLPAYFPEAETTNYYAIFEPDNSQSFNATVNHTNMSGTIAFGDPTTVPGPVETPINDAKRNVKGYVWSKADSDTTPANYNYSGESVPVGTFGDDGQYTGKMPGQDTTVSYRYRVDTAAPGLDLKVNYESTDHPAVTLLASKTDHPSPETPISLMPEDIYGYKCVGVTIVSGDYTGNLADGSGYVYGFTYNGQEPDEANQYAINSFMPNQSVELTYQYEATLPGYEMTVMYEDSDTNDPSLRNIVAPIKTGPHKAGTSVGGSSSDAYKQPYGYLAPYEHPVKPDDAEIRVDSSYQWGGIMPNDDAQVLYKYHRDSDKWVTVTYKPGDRSLGTLQSDGVSPDVHSAGSGSYTTDVLKADGSHDGYTLAQIEAKKLQPKVVMNGGKDKYYQFDGWFIDTTDDGLLSDGEKLLSPDYQFTADTTVTAHYGEKKDAWVTVKFAAGDRVTIADTQPKTYHTTFDQTWADIPPDKLPVYTWQTNYLNDGWWVNGEQLNSGDRLVDGAVYTAQCRPDPGVFGTEVTTPNAAPRLNTQGRGRITVYGIIEGYQYVLADAQGKVQSVEKGKFLSDQVYFDNLYPGAHYTVYEALGKVQVHVGEPFDRSQAGVSDGTAVLTPVVDTNYRIDYDNNSEGKTVLHIEPADRQSDYAVLDSRGHVVHTPKTDGSGWQRPSGNPGKMDFSGLDYNVEYTVVARPAGQTEIQAESLFEDGSVITTDPGGELDLPTYIIETSNGSIESVAGEAVANKNYCDTARKGDQVKIQAESSDDNGGTFSHWQFTIGSVSDFKREVETRELTFTMPDSNLVLTAIYNYPPSVGSPSNAKVKDEVRGGSREELSLDPDKIPDLEDKLTTDEDRTLMDLNKAEVTYKVVYRKNAVRATESNAIKAKDPYSGHEAAFKGAWGLNVSVERYVNGRKKGVASPSEAIRTYVQLGKNDVDMLDYNLYQVDEDPDSHGVTISPVADLSDNPEETNGLFTFNAEAGKRYVMVYSRAYRMNFQNRKVPSDMQETYHVSFKVRRKETPTQEQLNLKDPVAQTKHFTGSGGIEYEYDGWSYKEDKFREFDPDKKVIRKTDLYAYYGSNAEAVNGAREELDAAVKAAISMGDDHFLKVEESVALKQFIKDAQDVLDNPQATEEELSRAIIDLAHETKPYTEVLNDRYHHYEDIQSTSHSGGSHGGGGGGAGTKQKPFNDISPNDYKIGSNGNWVETTGPAGEKQMSFRLNGGSLISGMWAKLEYPAGTDTAGDGWYHFDSKGAMQTGWVCDATGQWYYCNTEKDGYAGKMATDWKLDAGDGHWYYLDPASGAMALGWKQLGGKWYYFSPVGGGTYAYDPAKEDWTYGGGNGRPMGSMYKNETTPDGYQVGADGAWVQ